MRIEEFDGRKAYLIHDFFTADECEAAVAMSESAGYGDAPVTTAGGPVVNKSMRNNERVMLERPDFAAQLWERAKPFVREAYGDWHAVGLNERLRFYRYDPGQKFALHSDGSFRRNGREMSSLTFMVYLNDDFTGGDTVFFDGWRKWCEARFRIRPVRGAALVFEHAMLHEGAEVTAGRKYVLRSDVMYRLAEGAADGGYPWGE